MKNVYEAVSSNKRRATVIVLLFFIFVAVSVYFLSEAFSYYFGYNFGSLGYVGLALIISGFSSFIGYYFSDKIVLSISRARPANKQRDFEFYTVTENLCIATGLPMPKLYVIEDSSPNAFATGRDPDHAVICATTGLLQKLNRTELEGVVGHEITHIRNYDTRLMSVVSVMVGIIALLGDWLLRARWFSSGRSRDNDRSELGAIFLIVGLIFAILSPIVAQLIQLALSRRRELSADAGSVMITRQPNGLISALEKISQDPEPLEVANKATAHLYIVNPFKGKTKNAVSRFSNLFNTHPPISERIKLLQQMA